MLYNRLLIFVALSTNQLAVLLTECSTANQIEEYNIKFLCRIERNLKEIDTHFCGNVPIGAEWFMSQSWSVSSAPHTFDLPVAFIPPDLIDIMYASKSSISSDRDFSTVNI